MAVWGTPPSPVLARSRLGTSHMPLYPSNCWGLLYVLSSCLYKTLVWTKLVVKEMILSFSLFIIWITTQYYFLPTHVWRCLPIRVYKHFSTWLELTDHFHLHWQSQFAWATYKELDRRTQLMHQLLRQSTICYWPTSKRRRSNSRSIGMQQNVRSPTNSSKNKISQQSSLGYQILKSISRKSAIRS